MKRIDAKNDIVLTPDYIAEFMCDIAGVNEESVVLDNAAGDGHLLLAAVKKGAKKVVGIEFEKFMYDRLSENLQGAKCKKKLICGDGLNMENIDMGEVDVFLSNPPFSAQGKGLCFDIEAIKRMTHGKAIILIQENAGKDSEYVKKLLEYCTLKASVHMPNIFIGSASVQTAIYVMECGVKHNKEDKAVFIDFSNDGYTRSGRKTAIGLVKDTDNATERYKEVLDRINRMKPETNYYEDCSIEDTFDEDITYNGHRIIDTTPTDEDFRRTISNYLEFKSKQFIQQTVGTDNTYLKMLIALGIDPRKLK